MDEVFIVENHVKDKDGNEVKTGELRMEHTGQGRVVIDVRRQHLNKPRKDKANIVMNPEVADEMHAKLGEMLGK